MKLTTGWILVFVIGIIFMIISAVVAVTPLPGEEEYAGTTFTDLQATNPRLANVIWHDYVAFGILLFGASLASVVLAWKGLSRGSRVAWYALLILGATNLAFLVLAHVPIGNTSFIHSGIPVILTLVDLVGLALAAGPVLGPPSVAART